MFTKGVLKILDGHQTKVTHIDLAFKIADQTGYELLNWNGCIFAKTIDSEYRNGGTGNGWIKTCLTLDDFEGQAVGKNLITLEKNITQAKSVQKGMLFHNIKTHELVMMMDQHIDDRGIYLTTVNLKNREIIFIDIEDENWFIAEYNGNIKNDFKNVEWKKGKQS